MAANDNATVTIDTDEWVYTDQDGITQHTVTNAQTFVFDLTAAATGSNYRMVGGDTVTCTDSTNLTIEKDPQFTWFEAAADATSAHRVGAIRIRENSGVISDFDITELTVNDVDEPTEITSLTATAKDNPMRTFTWATVTVAQ